MTPDPTLTDEELAEGTAVLLCGVGHVLMWPELIRPLPTDCPADMCLRPLTQKGTVVPIAALRASRAEVERFRSEAREEYVRAEQAEQELVAAKAEIARLSAMRDGWIKRIEDLTAANYRLLAEIEELQVEVDHCRVEHSA